MGNLSVSPRTVRGYLATLATSGTPARTIPFQFNPDTVTRDLRPRGTGPRDGGPADAHRLRGAPTETITMTVELDATDAVDAGTPDITAYLAALELLLYPASATVLAADALLDAGTLEIVPAQSPLTLLVWGPSRSVPVRVESLQITEQGFSPALRPVRATVQMALRVLSYDDLPGTDPGRGIFLKYQQRLENARGTGTGRPS